MTGINMAIAGAIVLMLVLLGVRKAKASAPAPSPSKPIDTSPPQVARTPPPPVVTLPGVTLTGTATDPLKITKAVITASDFTGMLKPGTTVQLAPNKDAIPLQCIGASWGNLGRCQGPGGYGCPAAACQ